jgi:hypothetical protein
MKIYISGAFDQWRATTARQFLFFPPKCLLGIPIDKKGQTSIAGIYTTHSTHVQSEKRKEKKRLVTNLFVSVVSAVKRAAAERIESLTTR